MDSTTAGSFCVSGLSLAGSLADAGGDPGLFRAGALSCLDLDGETVGLVTGLEPVEGVSGRGFGFGSGFGFVMSNLLLLDAKSCFLTGSISPSLFSNMDISVLAGGNDVVSVARSRLVTEVAALYVPVFPPSCLFAVCWLYGRGWTGWRELGLPDLLAARVAAMNDGDFGAGTVCFPGGISKGVVAWPCCCKVCCKGCCSLWATDPCSVASPLVPVFRELPPVACRLMPGDCARGGERGGPRPCWCEVEVAAMRAPLSILRAWGGIGPCDCLEPVF